MATFTIGRTPFPGILHAVKASCGHKYSRRGWFYSLDDAHKLREMLEKRPCDDCMVKMTKLNNWIADERDKGDSFDSQM